MNICLVLKGFLIGLGKIIPGVSGSLIAITLGLYDKMLDAVSHFFKNIKENMKFLGLICVGILLAVMLTSKFLMFLLSRYYIITMLFFIGLIIGGIPLQMKKIHLKFNKNILFSLLSFILIISLFFIKEEGHDVQNYSCITMFLIGILDAATMIIPGISGTAIMMLLGCYNTLLNMFSHIYSFSYLKDSIPFFLGIMVGVILVSKVIDFCFKNYKEQTNYAIIGFSLSSSLLLFLDVLNVNGNFIDYLIGFILLILGFKLSNILERL